MMQWVIYGLHCLLTLQSTIVYSFSCIDYPKGLHIVVKFSACGTAIAVSFGREANAVKMCLVYTAA
jgi:hypothetical protein